MTECDFTGGCPFFNGTMKEHPAMSNILRKKYCLGGEKENCARFLVRNAIGSEKVPIDLYPNQFEKARIVIEQEKCKF